LIDYPGKLAAIVFTQGCNFRCGYCYNAHLVCPQKFQVPVEEKTVLDFLESRKGKLEGVVVTGGEPTIQKGLMRFLAQLKTMGFAVKLDTNGSNPDVLTSLIDLRLVDFFAMDIKTSLHRYKEAIGIDQNTDTIKQSIDLIIQSGIPHQFRTTLVKSHCSEYDLRDIQNLIKGSRRYVLKSFIPSSPILDPIILEKPQYAPSEVERLRVMFQR
jgi:pyruvate formate lyase activating enzyme